MTGRGKGLVKLGDLSVTLSHLHSWRTIADKARLESIADKASGSGGGGGAGPWSLILEDDSELRLPAALLDEGRMAGERSKRERSERTGAPGSVRLYLEGVPGDADMILLHPSRLRLDQRPHGACV